MTENYNKPKWKNLATYLKIDKIDDSNVKEILSKFFLFNEKYTEPIKCKRPNCFCGMRLTHYYFVMNIETNEILIVGGVCRQIFWDTIKSNVLNNNKELNSDFYNYFSNSFNDGVFDKITDWNKYIEKCIKKYMEDCSLEHYETLKKLYINNEFITKYLIDNKPPKEEDRKKIIHTKFCKKYGFFNYCYYGITKRTEKVYMKEYQIINYFNDEDNFNFNENKFYRSNSNDTYNLEELTEIFKYLEIFYLNFDTKSLTIESLLHDMTILYNPDFFTKLGFFDTIDNNVKIWNYYKTIQYLKTEENYIRQDNKNDILKHPLENQYYDENVYNTLEETYRIDLSKCYEFEEEDEDEDEEPKTEKDKIIDYFTGTSNFDRYDKKYYKRNTMRWSYSRYNTALDAKNQYYEKQEVLDLLDKYDINYTMDYINDISDTIKILSND
jgi:hypothetical protein